MTEPEAAPRLVNITIHSSQFPENVRRDLLESLRSRQVNHKFHYDSVKQTHKWLALHEAYSPARKDPACEGIYEQSFKQMAERIRGARAHVIGLGCGGGQKDCLLIRLLAEAGNEVFYTPSDVSTAMVLVAHEAAAKLIPPERCLPLVCDLATTQNLVDAVNHTSRNTNHCPRIITFFGMLPNFEPDILTRIASLVGRDERLLVSANLAPGPDYAAGVAKVVPQYDNALTRDWLMTFLLDLGVEASDGSIQFRIEELAGLKRVGAYFAFSRQRTIQIEGEKFEFQSGDTVRLFISYRHTPVLANALLAKHGLKVLEQWITPSEEEGVFLCARS